LRYKNLVHLLMCYFMHSCNRHTYTCSNVAILNREAAAHPAGTCPSRWARSPRRAWRPSGSAMRRCRAARRGLTPCCLQALTAVAACGCVIAALPRGVLVRRMAHQARCRTWRVRIGTRCAPAAGPRRAIPIRLALLVPRLRHVLDGPRRACAPPAVRVSVPGARCCCTHALGCT